jgi:hypothetical protein
MSIGALTVSEAPISAQPEVRTSPRPPKLRQLVAKADQVAQPEAR